ncbi:MarR family transcriptional regulator [Pseudovibrio exalbescens]|uniref:MarR family winged helix-turn-helix transcriptional regulator n=1 Tax=Pseudovibrio exalbescens TaxID=197461 RepID=UPI0023669DF1|nr:MarR family transcriptional regulator [Pseudovibrio exalbescens]MDD7910810.1 MarR family transcriptional regulator [Pseudovibrio exalbescens]
MSLQSAAWERLIYLVDFVESFVAKDMQRKHNIGLSEFRALKFLEVAKDSELRMQELAGLLGLNQSSVTRLVGRLENNGYTVRDLCPDDKRGIYTVLTNRGRKRLSEARVDYEKALCAALEEAKDKFSAGDVLTLLNALSAKEEVEAS